MQKKKKKKRNIPPNIPFIKLYLLKDGEAEVAFATFVVVSSL